MPVVLLVLAAAALWVIDKKLGPQEENLYLEDNPFEDLQQFIEPQQTEHRYGEERDNYPLPRPR